MEQNRPDNGNHQQNVHLHMHHVCTCHGVYPATYYPSISYRPPILPYTSPAVPRPYMQHYQYTQYNVGSQYNMPITPVLATSATQQGIDTTVVLSARDRREPGILTEQINEAECTVPEPPEFEFSAGPGIPPVNELFSMDNSEENQINTDTFIKFLERSCVSAEQIAYRNRNRPCFRNIQNLCIRTRSEIIKPRTTISNIHSQGIPWATKDFIYAFVRLTNCWHILKGYWENREGSALGKIEKELNPQFRACYVRWEKETVELATELTRIFYNLDVNISNPTPNSNVHTASNLIPPQVSLLRNTTSDSFNKSAATIEITASATISTSSTSQNVRGILHIPATVSAETTDQANQTSLGDLYSKSDIDSDKEVTAVYMKPGSYRVPKKYIRNPHQFSNSKTGSPRVIEFLSTAQNISKGLETANEKYWIKVNTSLPKKLESFKSESDDINTEVYLNVKEWLSSSNFSDGDDQSSTLNSPPNLKPLVLADSLGGSSCNTESLVPPISTQDGKSEAHETRLYEMKSGGLTKKAKYMLEKIIEELKTTELTKLLDPDSVTDFPSLQTIQKHLSKDLYRFVNEFVKDVRHLINNAKEHFNKLENVENQLELFSNKFESSLVEHFPNYDFSCIIGHGKENVSKLKLKSCII